MNNKQPIMTYKEAKDDLKKAKKKAKKMQKEIEDILTKIKQTENTIYLDEFIFPNENTCPLCESKYIFKYDGYRRKCKDCTYVWITANPPLKKSE